MLGCCCWERICVCGEICTRFINNVTGNINEKCGNEEATSFSRHCITFTLTLNLMFLKQNDFFIILACIPTHHTSALHQHVKENRMVSGVNIKMMN